MYLSLVICTRNRAQQLTRALDAVAALRFSTPWELIIVDNGSNDTTAEVISRFRNSCRLNVVAVTERKAGVSNARNAGWRRAQGEIVAFTDDDCYPATDFLDQLATCFKATPSCYVGGRVLLYDQNDLPITIQTSTDRLTLAPGSFIRPGLLHGANLALRRYVLEEIGGFDPHLGAGTRLKSGEDLDVVARASAAGYAGAYDPRPIVMHHHGRRTSRDRSALLEAYDIGRGAYYLKCLLNRRLAARAAPLIGRHLAANIFKARFQVLKRELYGAKMYLDAMRRSGTLE